MAERPLGLIRLPARRPRVIRKITHWSATNTPKQVKDYLLNVQIRWIRAIQPHTCAADKACRQGKIIRPKQTYAQVIWPSNRLRVAGGGSIPRARKYHLGCVPAEFYPLMRLLFPARTRYLPKRRRFTWY